METQETKSEAPIIHRIRTYISASFCVSITAATGIPKLETGPQKSRKYHWLSATHAIHRNLLLRQSAIREKKASSSHSRPPTSAYSPSVSFAVGRSRDRKRFGKLGSIRTGWADIVQHRVGADLGVDCLNSSSHCESCWELSHGIGFGGGEIGIWRMRKCSTHPASAVSRELHYANVNFVETDFLLIIILLYWVGW